MISVEQRNKYECSIQCCSQIVIAGVKVTLYPDKILSDELAVFFFFPLPLRYFCDTSVCLVIFKGAQGSQGGQGTQGQIGSKVTKLSSSVECLESRNTKTKVVIVGQSEQRSTLLALQDARFSACRRVWEKSGRGLPACYTPCRSLASSCTSRLHTFPRAMKCSCWSASNEDLLAG